MKSQVLADFVAKFTMTTEEVEKKDETFRSKWSLYVINHQMLEDVRPKCC